MRRDATSHSCQDPCAHDHTTQPGVFESARETYFPADGAVDAIMQALVENNDAVRALEIA